MQIVLQGEFSRWRENAGVYAIGLAITVLGEEQDLAGRRRNTAGGLIVEPVARREQRETQDDGDGDIVLPSAAFIRPEKCA